MLSSLRELFAGRRRQDLACLVFVVFCTLYGCIIRAHHFESQSLWLDEAVSVVHATSILDHGYPCLPNGRTSWDSAPYHYLNSLMLCLFQDVHVASRILSILAGCAAIPLMFLLCRNIFNSRMHGLAAVMVLTFSFAEVAWSRQARFYTFLQLLLLSGFYLGLKIVGGAGRKFWIAALVVATLATLTHRSGYALFLFYMLLAATHLQHLLQRFQNRSRVAIVAGISAALLVLIIFPSHSNLVDAARRLFSRSQMNYSVHYIIYLWQELGFLLPLSVLGMILGSIRWPKTILPLSVVLIAYFGVISKGWNYFAFRYAFPLIAPMIFFSTLLCSQSLFVRIRYRPIRLGLFVASCCMLAISAYTAHLAPPFQSRYILGYTAPQPEWKDAYQLISQRESMIPKASSTPSNFVTVSALPLFHDIYLGKDIGKKYYLPISHTGYPGDIAATPPYTEATLVTSLQELLSINGYLILDDFGLRMLANKEIQEYLANRTPNLVIKHEHNVFVWILDDAHSKNKEKENRTKHCTTIFHSARGMKKV